MEDYYSLQSVFAALDRADRDFDADPQVAGRRVELAARREPLQARRKQLDQQIADRKTPEIRKLEKRVEKLRAAADKRDVKQDIPRSFAYGYHSQVAGSADTTKWVQVGRRNEAFDLSVYAHALWIYLKGHLVKWGSPPAWCQDMDLNSEVMTKDERQNLKQKKQKVKRNVRFRFNR